MRTHAAASQLRVSRGGVQNSSSNPTSCPGICTSHSTNPKPPLEEEQTAPQAVAGCPCPEPWQGGHKVGRRLGQPGNTGGQRDSTNQFIRGRKKAKNWEGWNKKSCIMIYHYRSYRPRDGSRWLLFEVSHFFIWATVLHSNCCRLDLKKKKKVGLFLITVLPFFTT